MFAYILLCSIVLICCAAVMIRAVKWLFGFIYDVAPYILIFIILAALVVVAETPKKEDNERHITTIQH